MAFLAAAAPYIFAAGTAINAIGTIGQGNLAKAMGIMQAKQLRQQALADQASSQVVAGQERKKAEYLKSRVRSLAGASGTGMDSPDIVNTISDIDQQGAFNALSALYSGQTSADSKNLAAGMAIAEGNSKKASSLLSAGGTILTSAAGWKTLYG